MSIQTFLLAVVVVLYGAAQYILAAQALRDLLRRSRVRGDNKAVWGIVILTVPIFGALLYNWMGPTSLLRRPTRIATPHSVTDRRAGMTTLRNKVTPVIAMREARPAHVVIAPHHPARSFNGPGHHGGAPAGSRTHARETDQLRRTGS